MKIRTIIREIRATKDEVIMDLYLDDVGEVSGVVKLFKLPKWQKTLKNTWNTLEKGEYDWAHLAYSIWPERVIRASHNDRSYAIAHDLEDALWEEIETGRDRQGNPKTKWVPKDLSEDELQQLIKQKTGR
jgi:hypothetical protein